MSQEKFWILFSKKLSGEISVAELRELENLIHHHPEWQYAVQNLEDLWKHKPSKDQMVEEDAYMLHMQRMSEENPPFDDSRLEGKNRVRKWYWVAAAVLLLTLGIFAFDGLFSKSTGKEKGSSQENQVSTRKGSKSRVQLPDGSIVWLNAGSKLTYGKEYGQQTREVALAGEGYFDVTKMEGKPFIIHTSSIDIRVLGTVFNIRAYPEDKQTEASLIRGSIEITIKNRPSNKIILSPNEKLVVENRSVATTEKEERKDVSPAIAINKLKFSPVDSTVAETQWIENKLVFDDESFEELAIRMERWYDVKIGISDPQLLQKRLTGNFERETIEQALEALKISIPFKHEQTGNKITIYR